MTMTYTFNTIEQDTLWVPDSALVDPADYKNHSHSHNPEMGWCGDCGQHVPLLDDVGTDIIQALYLRLEEAISAYKNGGLPSNWAPVGPLYGPIHEAYVQLTKQPVNFAAFPFKGKELAAHLIKHSVQKMGPECGECGHHFPTEKAILCTHCGSWRS